MRIHARRTGNPRGEGISQVFQVSGSEVFPGGVRESSMLCSRENFFFFKFPFSRSIDSNHRELC
jgi:hypothetical protein